MKKSHNIPLTMRPIAAIPCRITLLVVSAGIFFLQFTLLVKYFHRSNLINHLFANYERYSVGYIRPVSDTVTTVVVRMLFHHLIEMAEVNDRRKPLTGLSTTFN